MQRMVEKAFFALICFEINGGELCEEIKNLITPDVLPLLFKFSKRYDVAHLVGDALDRNGLLPDGAEVKKRFLQERNLAVYRYEQIQYELEQICETLNEANIPFIPLKGSVIRSLYPEPWMRTSCDIDIFVDESADLEQALSIIENAKTSRPSVCNAAESCLVHEKIAAQFLPKLKKKLSQGYCNFQIYSFQF